MGNIYSTRREKLIKKIRENQIKLDEISDNDLTIELCETFVSWTNVQFDKILERMKKHKILSSKISEICLYVMTHRCLMSFRNIKYIPIEIMTPEFLKQAITHGNCYIIDVPAELRTDEIYKLGVQQDGISLWMVPEELRTKEICDLAIDADGDSLMSVPMRLRTPEMCLRAIKNYAYPATNAAIRSVPKEILTDEMCKLAVTQRGFTLAYIPELKRTQELCELAVRCPGFHIDMIDEKFRHGEVMHLYGSPFSKYMMLCGPNILESVPKQFMTKHLCMEYVKTHKNLYGIPDEYKNEMEMFLNMTKRY